LPAGRAVLAEWGARLGTDFDGVQHVLRSTGREAGVYPNLNGGGFPLQIVKHGVDDYAAVPEDGGDVLELRRSDVIVHELDLRRLGRGLVTALGGVFEFEPLPARPLWRLGTLRSAGTQSTAIWLVLPYEPQDLERALEHLQAEFGQVDVVCVPTRRCVKPAAERLVHATRGLLLVLDEVLPTFINGQWQAVKLLDKQLRSYRESAAAVPQKVLTDRERDVLTAMEQLEAFDSDHRQSTEQIARRAGHDFNSLKPVMRDLKDHGFLETREGRGGGCWLTEKGRARSEALRTGDENG